MLNFTCLGSLYAVAAANFKGLVRPYTVPCDRPVKQDYLEGKTNRNKSKNSNIVSNKVKKVNLAEPGPSCTVLQNGETSGLCNGKEEEANRQWKGLVHFLSIVTQIAPLPVS